MKLVRAVFATVAIVIYVLILAPRIAWSIYRRNRDE